MNLTRRNFLKFSGLAAVASFFGSLPLVSGCRSRINKLKSTGWSYSICPFCSLGCGMIVYTRNGKIINIEGDTEHPINRGTLCAKGSSAFQISAVNEKRLTKVQYRAPYAAEWKEITWAEALRKIAGNIKNTREKSFAEYEGKSTANRTEGLAFFTGSSLNNEEYYLLSKMARLLGVPYIVSETGRINSASSGAMTNTFGFGGMTNSWTDLQNSDAILMIGCNPAENHPVSAEYILKAKGKGAKIIHIDPRFTKTSVIADYYSIIRPGTDTAFMGGIINYSLQNNRIHREYVLEYTNAAYLVIPDYKFQNGVFSGFKAGKYFNDSWEYEKDRKGNPRLDKTLKNSNSVFQIIKNHFSRYTPETVSATTGCSVETFLKIADQFTSTYKTGKAGAVLCSSGSLQHFTGSQNIRALAILQLLLGNIGIAGGGLNIIAGGSNGCGLSDHFMANYLPGYLEAPLAEEHATLDLYIKNTTPPTNNPMSTGILGLRNIQIVNMLKSLYGDSATKENDFCFHWLPKTNRNYSLKSVYNSMQKGVIKGAILAGADPVISQPDTINKLKALENIEWIAVSDIFETETASFWKRPGAKPEKIKTEVFLLPSASPFEKEGSLTSSCRWVQWRNKAAEPPKDARADLWIYDNIFKEIKMLYFEDKNAAFPDSILYSNWDYTGGGNIIDPHIVAREINGYECKTKKLVSDFRKLKDDGSTAAGNWLYCGSVTEKENMTARRNPKDASNKLGLYPGWAWSWPSNTRILYNRASVDRNGVPWNKDKWLMKWDDKWKGDSVNGEEGLGPSEKNPFMMLGEGVGRLFSKDMAGGPLPEHYEPAESPAINILNSAGIDPLYNKAGLIQLGNPMAYPYIATTFGMGEGSVAGAGKNLSWLCELSPAVYCEISKSLAESKGIKNGDKAEIKSKRGRLTAYCLVTERMQPLIINGRRTEIVAIIINSGHETSQNNYNQLTHDTGDAETDWTEDKAFLVNISREA